MQTFKSWATNSSTNFDAELRLFCFPYAGGGASSFRSWSTSLTPVAEVCPVELPGHGCRLLEHPFTQLEPLIQSLARTLLPYLDKPFAFFGHSMGGLISFELAQLLRQKYNLSPVHLFISGRRAPQIPTSESPIHNLPKSEFLNKLRRFNGTPEAVLEDTELMKLLLPALRADFALLGTYVYVSKPRLDCPITVLGGLQDLEASYNDLEAWREQTNAAFSLQMFEGDHFFIHSIQSSLLEFIDREISTIASKINS